MGAGNTAGYQAGMDTAGAVAAGGYGTDASTAAAYGPQAGYGDVTGQAAGYGDASQAASAATYAQASQGALLCLNDLNLSWLCCLGFLWAWEHCQ